MPRKGENIYKRKDGRWEARYILHYENGKAKYHSVYGKTYTEVREKRREALLKPAFFQASAVKRLAAIDEICRLWLISRKPGIKESTYTRYVRIVDRYILKYIGGCLLSHINAETIKMMQGKLMERLSDKTVSDIMSVFKGIWQYGKENGYPCCSWKIQKIKRKSNNMVTVLSSETIQRIAKALESYDEHVRIGIIFTLYTGIRIGELCGLRWSDIDSENGYIYIRRTIERIANTDAGRNKTKVIISEPKTDNSIRIIPMPTELIGFIKQYYKSNDTYLLTGTCKYTEPHNFYMRYKTFLRKNDLGDYTFHELRHTFATRCVDLGFDIKSLSEILGHSDVRTTMNLYVHPTLQMKKRQMDMLRL